MTVSRLLDSDVAVEALRGRDRAVLNRLAAEPAPRISSITWTELAYGVHRSPQPRRGKLDGFTALVEPLAFDVEAARQAAEVRATLAAAGTPIGHYDVLIAGHALALGVPLVTRSKREFERVRGLAVEVW